MEKPEPPSSEFLERNRILGFRDSPLIFIMICPQFGHKQKASPSVLVGCPGCCPPQEPTAVQLGDEGGTIPKGYLYFPRDLCCNMHFGEEGRREGILSDSTCVCCFPAISLTDLFYSCKHELIIHKCIVRTS